MNNNLQNKLQEFSATPPDGVWQKIASGIDDYPLFAERLGLYEENPAAGVWESIEKDLDEFNPAKIVPLSIRFKKPLRYAAVACFLALVLVTVTLTVHRTEAGAIDPGSNTTVPSNTSAASSGETNKNAQGIASSEETKSGNKKNRFTSDSIIPFSTERSVDRNVAYSSLNNYVVFNDGDGRLRRVSKKLANFVRCGDTDVACQQRLLQLKQRLAAKAMTTDFTGILEMMRQLQ